jgi:tetratricopeptide (TPR) repeat protein/predicted Ser/Thr protein kinase
MTLLDPFGWSHRFDDLQKIGSGAMGQVWQARDTATGRIVALKFLDPARSGDEQTLARLESEGQTLTRLREAGAHENVVPILDFQITDEQACLVMEFIPGLHLRKWCSTHQLSLTDRVRLIAQVARAAGWFHGLGVVHRDLKPANILVHAVSRQPVIVDFSIAKVEDELTLTLTNEALGTAPYMAPEQFDRRRAPVSPATDVYALGATLYELLTEVPPHPGEFTVIIQRHNDEKSPPRPSALNPAISRDLECILLKALSHRPADRYTDGTALAEDLEHHLAGEPVRARPLPLGIRLLRRVRRKPALTAALAACVGIGSFTLLNVHRAAAQRERFALETRLTNAMQNTQWDVRSLAEADATLAELRGHHASLAEQVRDRLHADVVHDVEARLQQQMLRDEDYAWLHAMAGWLHDRLPAEAARLNGLITDRAGRWETVAEVSAPFTDLQGLFPVSHLRATRDLLHPVFDPGEEPLITVTKSVSVPMELSCTMVAESATFEPLTLVFYNQGTRLSAGLYKVRHFSKSMRGKLELTSSDPESYVLTIKLNEQHVRYLHLPDTHLLDQPFLFTLRVERETAEAELNGRSLLRVDTPFTFSNGQESNYWRITWPEKIGLKAITLRKRRADAASPLEEADLAAMQGRYAEAIRLYENMLGDPLHGSEASYKTAECLALRGDSSAALQLWQKLADGPPSDWHDRSLIRLWTQSVISRQGDASSHLSRLPDPLPESILGKITPWQMNGLIYWYAPAGMSIALPRMDTQAVLDATKAFHLLRLSSVQIANRFALAHHSARLDERADYLYRNGLDDALTARLEADDLLALTNCLDQWCRISPSESSATLSETLRRWEKKRRSDPTVQALWHMEQARVAARAQNVRGAIGEIREARQLQPQEIDDRVHTSVWLLEGMLYRLQQDEEKAQQAWHEARSIAHTVTMQHPLHLMDCVLLDCLTQSWDLRRLGKLLPAVVTKHLRDQERTDAQAAIHQTFLTDPAWLTTFNEVLQSAEGRKFAEDYVLCRQPPRELVLEFYRLLFAHYFLTTAFPKATPDQATHVQSIVKALVNEMAMNPRLKADDLHAYLRAWNDPAATAALVKQDHPTVTPSLVTELKWLLRQRHISSSIVIE